MDAKSLLPGVWLITLAITVLGAAILYQAISERRSLLAAKTTQEAALKQAQQIKVQLDTLASATARLAEQGNAGAQTIIETMRREGISVRP